MKKLGLVGYYKFGNYGDELFLDVFKESLPEFGLSVMHTMTRAPYFTGGVKSKVNSVDGILIGGGDLIIPWALSGLYWKKEYLEKPVFIVGVGVPTWGKAKEEVIAHMREFFQHSNVKYILCRDSESAAWIRKHLEPVVPVRFAPDLVCALGFGKHERKEKKILGLITRKQSRYDFSNIEKLCRRAIGYGYDIHKIILGVDNVKKDDLAVAEMFGFPFQKIVTADTIDQLTEEIAKCSVVCSMKFHGCVVAYMMGIPIISLSRADKFKSFFRTIDKELFLSVAADKEIQNKLIEPMYEIPGYQIDEMRKKTRVALADLREELVKTTG